MSGGIDLLPWRAQRSRQRRLRALGLLALVLMGCAVLPWRALHSLQALEASRLQQLPALQAQQARLLAERREQQQLVRDSQHLQAELIRLQQPAARHDRLLAVLDEALRYLPEGVYFERLSLADDRLEILALTASARQAAQWLEQLQGSRWLAAARWQESRQSSPERTALQQLRMDIQLPAAWPAPMESLP